MKIKIIGYIASVMLLILILCQSIIIPTFFMPFFHREFKRLDVANTIQVDYNELIEVTKGLLDYMRGRRDTIDDIKATVAGEERLFFSEIEIRHMIDVRFLYDLLFLVRNIALALFVSACITLLCLKEKLLLILARLSRHIFIGFLSVLALLVLIISIDFERAFNRFHLIFFNNDDWLLDPRVDLLINMVPLEFFINISIFIGLILVGVPLLLIGASTIYLHRKKEKC